MKFRIGGVLAGAMTLAAATVMVTAGSASAAAHSSYWDHVYSGTGVKVYVKEYGDVVSVCDAKANGHSAWVWVADVSDNLPGYKSTVTNGYGSCTTRRASHGGKYNLREHNYITLNFEGAGGNGSYAVTYLNDH